MRGICLLLVVVMALLVADCAGKRSRRRGRRLLRSRFVGRAVRGAIRLLGDGEDTDDEAEAKRFTDEEHDIMASADDLLEKEEEE